MKLNQGTNNNDYYIAMGIAIGAGLGLIFGLLLENLALGVAFGAGGGVVLGSVMRGLNGEKDRKPPSD